MVGCFIKFFIPEKTQPAIGFPHRIQLLWRRPPCLASLARRRSHPEAGAWRPSHGELNGYPNKKIGETSRNSMEFPDFSDFRVVDFVGSCNHSIFFWKDCGDHPVRLRIGPKGPSRNDATVALARHLMALDQHLNWQPKNGAFHGFPTSWGYPNFVREGLFRENPNLKWMITGGSPIPWTNSLVDRYALNLFFVMTFCSFFRIDHFTEPWCFSPQTPKVLNTSWVSCS